MSGCSTRTTGAVGSTTTNGFKATSVAALASHKKKKSAISNKMATQDGNKMATQDGNTRWQQDGNTRWQQDGNKMATRWQQDGNKMEHSDIPSMCTMAVESSPPGVPEKDRTYTGAHASSGGNSEMSSKWQRWSTMKGPPQKRRECQVKQQEGGNRQGQQLQCNSATVNMPRKRSEDKRRAPQSTLSPTFPPSPPSPPATPPHSFLHTLFCTLFSAHSSAHSFLTP
jgi:hypothetical protein